VELKTTNPLSGGGRKNKKCYGSVKKIAISATGAERPKRRGGRIGKKDESSSRKQGRGLTSPL